MIIADTSEFKLEVGGGVASIDDLASLSVVIFESVFQKSKYVIRLTDRSESARARWNAVAVETDIKGSVRIGSVTNELPEGKWSRWKKFRVTEMFLRDAGDIIEVTLVGQDLFYDLKNRSSQYVFKEKTVSEMLTQIARDHDANSDLLSTTGDYSLLQGTETDFDFIKESLLPRARVKNPAEVFLLYVSHKEPKSTLVLSSLNEKEKEKAKINFSYDLTEPSAFDPFKRAFLGSHISYVSIGPSNFGTLATTFDPLKRQGFPYLVEGLENDSDREYPTLGTRKSVPINGGLPGSVQSIVMDALEFDFRQELATRVSWEPFFTHRVIVPTLLLPEVRIGEIGHIDAKTTDDEKLFSTGKYLIYAVYHIVGRNARTATITFLGRRGAVSA